MCAHTPVLHHQGKFFVNAKGYFGIAPLGAPDGHLKTESILFAGGHLELVTQYLLGLEDGQEENVVTNFISLYYPEG